MKLEEFRMEYSKNTTGKILEFLQLNFNLIFYYVLNSANLRWRKKFVVCPCSYAGGKFFHVFIRFFSWSFEMEFFLLHGEKILWLHQIRFNLAKNDNNLLFIKRHWLILYKYCVEFFHLSSALSRLSRWHVIPFSRHKQHRVWEDLRLLMNREWLGQSTNKFENVVDGTKILQQPTTFTSHSCKRQTKNYLSKMRPIAWHVMSHEGPITAAATAWKNADVCDRKKIILYFARVIIHRPVQVH